MNTEPQPLSQSGSEDEIDLLDLLVVVAENLKLLILGPAVAGLLALGIATYVMKPSYESVSVLKPADVTPQAQSGFYIKPICSDPQVILSLVQSSDVLAAVSRELGINADATASIGRQNTLVTLVTRAATPQQAQKLNNTIWKQVFPLTKPAAKDIKLISEQLEIMQDSLASGQALELSLSKQLQSEQRNQVDADLYVKTHQENNQLLHKIRLAQLQLETLSEAHLIQSATLPSAPSKPKKALIAIVTSLATGLVLLIFVFIRQSLRSANNDPQQAEKLRRLRLALGFKS